MVNLEPTGFWFDEFAEIDKANWEFMAFGTGALWIGNDGTVRHIPLNEINSSGAQAAVAEEQFAPAAEPGLVLGTVTRPNGKTQNVVSAKAAIADKSEFGVIDAMAPNARLDILIQTAIEYRRDNPGAPVRATELAVNEVLQLRKDNAELQKVRDKVRKLGALIGWAVSL